MPLPDYEQLGYNKFLTKMPPAPEGQQGGMGNSFNFEQMQVSGNMGDSFSLGGNRLQFDGVNGRILINDGTTDIIAIGEI